MADKTPWQSWVEGQIAHRWGTGHGAQAAAARATGIPKSTLNQWVRQHHRPDPDKCRLAAEAFGVPVLTTLMIAGHISAHEAAGASPEPVRQIADLSASEIAGELIGKIKRMETELRVVRAELNRLRANAAPKPTSGRTPGEVPPPGTREGPAQEGPGQDGPNRPSVAR
jgi:transcriptional regulator with XRE-family HTH domain